MTHKQLKAYKSLNGFNFYINGKVSSVRLTELPHTTTQPKHYLFTALIQHSQTVSVPTLRVWVRVKESGEVICAHYTGMLCTCRRITVYSRRKYRNETAPVMHITAMFSAAT